MNTTVNKINKELDKKEIVTYSIVKNQTTEEYFNNNQFSIDAFEKKYAMFPEETYVQALKRVCDYIASVEDDDEKKKYWSERWFDEIYNDWWHPAGSIMQGAGCDRKVSLCNCCTVSMGAIDEDKEWDNLESIIRNTAYTVAKTAAYRQGLGVDFSRIRPAGTQVLNSSNESSGAIHWMKLIDSLGYYVGQKGRIPAMLFSLNCSHPDLEEFINVKSDKTKIQNANISVQCTDDFYDAVEKDKDWKLHFTVPAVKKGQRIYIDVHSTVKDSLYDEKLKKHYYIATHNKKEEKIEKKIKARKILEMIANGMLLNAEPGIQNIDLARKFSNSDYVYDPDDEYDSRVISSNACCVVENTKIMTNKGCKTIKELYDAIQVGQKFLAMSFNIEENVFEFKNIVAAWQNRTDTTVTLKIQGDDDKVYEIECSSDHPILTWNRGQGYVRADEINDYDQIVVYGSKKCKLISITINSEKKPLYDIEVEDNHNFVVNDGIVIKNSEQYLSRDSLCVLSSINASRFSSDQNEYESELEKIGESINRFLDNVNEAELRYKTYATPFQKLAIEKLRRTGAGVTNISGWLFKKNLEYGSKEGNKCISHFIERYNYHLYRSSINTGKEKGSFGLFNRSKLEKSPFIQRMMKLGLEFDALRNVTCSSVAPTGCPVFSTSIKTNLGDLTLKEIFELNGISEGDIEEEGKWFTPEKEIKVQNVNGEYKKVTKMFYNGFAPICTIKLDNGNTFSATLDHKVLIDCGDGFGEWKEISQLSREDKIISLEKINGKS